MPKTSMSISGSSLRMPKTLLQEVMKPTQRLELASKAKLQKGISIRVLCYMVLICITCNFYKPKISDKNDEIDDWQRRPSEGHKHSVIGLILFFTHQVVKKHKLLYRMEIWSNSVIKPNCRIKLDKLEAFAVPSDTNQVRSMYFVSDYLKSRC